MFQWAISQLNLTVIEWYFNYLLLHLLMLYLAKDFIIARMFYFCWVRYMKISMEGSPYYQFSVYLVASPLTTDYWLCKWCSFYLCDRYRLKSGMISTYLQFFLLVGWQNKDLIVTYGNSSGLNWELLHIPLELWTVN